jgi:predicted AlkP superfamily pyrophosphatase or phosphodiesterase
MYNLDSINAVNASWAGQAGIFRKPLYDSYCFSRIPESILYLLGATGTSALALPASCFPMQSTWNEVVVILVDGLGWINFEKYGSEGFFELFAKEGIISKITSQYPSTTSAHVTTLASGLSPNKSGVFEWQQYSPELAATVKPLRFSGVINGKELGLGQQGIDPHVIFPSGTLYERLENLARYRSLLVTLPQIAANKVNGALAAGAQVVTYTKPHELTALLPKVFAGHSWRYAQVYTDVLDEAGHIYGFGSPSYNQIALALFAQLESAIQAIRKPGRLILVTADHGHICIEPKDASQRIDVDKECPWLVSTLTAPSGTMAGYISPSGSLRDMYLHVRPDVLQAAVKRLSHDLQGRAEVLTTQELYDSGWFGSLPGDPALLNRIGTLAIMPYLPYCLMWKGQWVNTMSMKGFHGGASPQEMEIPLMVIE